VDAAGRRDEAGRDGGPGAGGGAVCATRRPAVTLRGRGPPEVEGRPRWRAARDDVPPRALLPAADAVDMNDVGAAVVPAEDAGRVLPGPLDMGRELLLVEGAMFPAPGTEEGCCGAEKSMGAEVVSDRDTAAFPPSKFVRQIMTMSSPPAVAKYAPSGVKVLARTPALCPWRVYRRCPSRRSHTFTVLQHELKKYRVHFIRACKHQNRTTTHLSRLVESR
jgi:hypothetical protein